MPLQELKNLYKENANLIPGWEKLDVNKLCDIYVHLEEDDPLRDSYLSAIIYKCWNQIPKAYNSQGIKMASMEDCYNWLIDSILNTLEKHVWTDENHKLYQDEKAPEKAIHVTFHSYKVNFYYLANMQKRILNYKSLDLDYLIEEQHLESLLPAVVDKYSYQEDILITIVKNYFNNKDYFMAFALDAILNADVFDIEQEKQGAIFVQFNPKKLKKHLKNLDEDYLKTFTATYSLDLNDVMKTLHYMRQYSQVDMDTRINKLLKDLKLNPEIKEVIVKDVE